MVVAVVFIHRRDRFSPTAGMLFVRSATNGFSSPNAPGGGPSSGFKAETGSLQTHNVAARLPITPGYSPLWAVVPLNNAVFATIHDLTSAVNAPQFSAVGNVNRPIVAVRP